MVIEESLASAIKNLKIKNIKNPHTDAEILLSHILTKNREYLYTHPKKTLSHIQTENYNKLINRRIKGDPVAYLIGYKYFYGNKFIVNKNVLIPRPETEMMIDIIRQQKSDNRNQKIFIDLGTGSGCIIISLAKLEKSRIYKYIGIDISRKALSIAKKNAKLNNVDDKIRFIKGNLLFPITKSKILDQKYQIIITANLPYLTPRQIKESPSIQREPRLALVAGKDGLKYYRKLFKQIKKLKEFNKDIALYCEIDESQAEMISELTKQTFPSSQFKIKKDLAGLERMIILKFLNE